MSIDHHQIPFEAYRGEEPYIFVCYSHHDSGLVFNEIKRLHDAGYHIWYDEGISPTQEWSEEIAAALEKSAVFLYFVSPRSVDSKNCRDEAFFALDSGKPFLAVYVEETKVPSGLRLRTNRIQAVLRYQLSTSVYEKRLERALEPFAVTGTGAEPSPRRQEERTTARPISSTEQALKRQTNLTPKRLAIGIGGLLAIVLLVIWITFLSQKTDVGPSSQIKFDPDSNPDTASNITPTPGNSPTPSSTPTPDEALPVVGIIGFDDAIKVSELKAPHLQYAARAVGRIMGVKDGRKAFCTGFLIRNGLVMTAGNCVEGMVDAVLNLGDENEFENYKVETPAAEIVSDADGLDFALLRVDGNPGSKYGTLRLATSGPTEGQALFLVMFRHNGKFAVTRAADCKVFSLEDSVFNHRCDTGGGATGSPILAADATKVLGIQSRRDAQGGLATRANKSLRRSKLLQANE